MPPKLHITAGHLRPPPLLSFSSSNKVHSSLHSLKGLSDDVGGGFFRPMGRGVHPLCPPPPLRPLSPLRPKEAPKKSRTCFLLHHRRRLLLLLFFLISFLFFFFFHLSLTKRGLDFPRKLLPAPPPQRQWLYSHLHLHLSPSTSTSTSLHLHSPSFPPPSSSINAPSPPHSSFIANHIVSECFEMIATTPLHLPPPPPPPPPFTTSPPFP